MSILTQMMEASNKIAVLGHIRPDGDCIGSCLAVRNYIKEVYPEKEVQVYLETPPAKFSYLKGFEDISQDSGTGAIYDLCVCLDTSERARLGEFEVYLAHSVSSIDIDHHVTNQGFCGRDIIEGDVSSTCELLFGYLDYDKISKTTASCLYTGIVDDTNLFKNLNTTPSTMVTAGKLMEKGINFNEIINASFYRKTYVQNQILGRALLESVMLLDGRCIFSGIRKKNMEFYGVTGADLEGIVDQLKVTAGVEVAIFLYEVDTSYYKVSLRSSSKVDVAKIAQYFGGGGHMRAAGCNMSGSVHDVVNNLTLHIEKQLEAAEEEEA